MSSKKTHKGTYARVCKWSRLSGFSGLQQAICAWIGIAQARQSTREKSAPYGDTPEDRSEEENVARWMRKRKEATRTFGCCPLAGSCFW